MTVHLHFHRDTALCLAKGHITNMHAHQALQITVGLDRCFELELEDDETRSRPLETSFACIPPHCGHRIVAAGVDLAYLFFDCTTTAYAKWRASGGVPCEPDAATLDALHQLMQSRTVDAVAAKAFTDRWREQALPGLAAVRPDDLRIAQAVDFIDAHPIESLNYTGLAQMVHLSPSRFASLFRDQTGLPVRNYVLWRRLVYALECLDRGDSITTAAHNAGFSDCAHLSRSFHRIFGTMPSNLRMR